MDLDRNDFADAVSARAAQWNSAGVRWELHYGPLRDKSAAWIAADLNACLDELTDRLTSTPTGT
ncbi:hypothetical protein [Micromonospora lupini]|nr:hypothetical protein [Micromonospora lupini]